MIVVDASVIGPIVLLDERPLPAPLDTAIRDQRLTAPAHWSIETANMLSIARRRGRIDEPAWAIAFARLGGLRVAVMPPLDWPTLRHVSAFAEDHRLTVYDAAYLHLALKVEAALATLDQALANAARRAGVPVLTQ